jgi:sialate O-acetylesterase
MRRALIALALLLGAAVASAEVRLAGIFGEHMVLQRQAPIRVWGHAAPSEVVRLSLAGHQRTAQAARDGRWSVLLPALPAGGPHELVARGSNTVVLRDVWVGELWLIAGQSNMEWPLSETDGAAQAIASAEKPLIRHVKLPHRVALRPQADSEPARWQVANPATAGLFSAVGWHFAQRLQSELKVPIGLVNVSWGGTHQETWTRRGAALGDPDLAPIVRNMPSDTAAFAVGYAEQAAARVRRWHPGWQLVDEARLRAAEPETDDAAWPTLQVPQAWEKQGLDGFDGVVWLRRTVELTAGQAAGAATLQLGAIDDCDESFVNGRRVGGLCAWDTPRRHAVPSGTLRPGRNVIAVRVLDTGGGGGFHGEASALALETAAGRVPLAGPWRAWVASALPKTEPAVNDLPTLLHNGMLQPVLPLRVRGVLWYQGESNVPRAARYAPAFRRFITDWRAQAGQPAMPFYFVQLAAYLPRSRNTLDGSDWAELREAQRQALALPATGMAVTIDVGDEHDIHPRNKQAVGERLARLALKRVHGRPVVDSGPTLRAARPQGSRMVLDLDPHAQALAVREGGELRGFAVADASRRFVPAQARIEGRRIVVQAEGVVRPMAVRYAWVDSPGEANLVNDAGLPASPFRTDRWPLRTAAARFMP